MENHKLSNPFSFFSPSCFVHQLSSIHSLPLNPVLWPQLSSVLCDHLLLSTPFILLLLFLLTKMCGSHFLWSRLCRLIVRMVASYHPEEREWRKKKNRWKEREKMERMRRETKEQNVFLLFVRRRKNKNKRKVEHNFAISCLQPVDKTGHGHYPFPCLVFFLLSWIIKTLSLHLSFLPFCFLSLS